MDVDGLASARFALDVNGLDGLRRAASRDPQAQLGKAARQFEALFLGHMLKTMRQAGFQSGLTDNRQVRFYQNMLDQQLAQKLSDRGVGLAQMLERQLSNQVGRTAATKPDALAPTVLAHIPRGRPQSLAGVPSVTGLGPVTETVATGAATPESGSLSDRFVHRFAGVAKAAARISGVSPLVILAQAALETGWGKKMAAASDGSSSHNLFGIKAGSGWQGGAAHNRTHEYVGGHEITVNQPFRMYGSYADSFADHARLLADSPRYAPVRAAATPEQEARALQASGYATDPHYADKLITIMRQIGDVIGF